MHSMPKQKMELFPGLTSDIHDEEKIRDTQFVPHISLRGLGSTRRSYQPAPVNKLSNL